VLGYIPAAGALEGGTQFDENGAHEILDSLRNELKLLRETSCMMGDCSSKVDLEDGLSTVDLDVFNGEFRMISLGVPVIPYSLLTDLEMGRAYGNAREFGIGTSVLDFSEARGVSNVVNKRTECCSK
jgi:hypothetical protein